MNVSSFITSLQEQAGIICVRVFCLDQAIAEMVIPEIGVSKTTKGPCSKPLELGKISHQSPRGKVGRGRWSGAVQLSQVREVGVMDRSLAFESAYAEASRT